MKITKSIVAGLYLGFAAFGLSATPAMATLIDQGTTTLDTDQNLVWLDLTESTNRSYGDVAGQFGASGDFAGYRHATLTEVATLFSNAGFALPYFNAGATPTELSAAGALIDLFGATFTDTGSHSGYFDYMEAMFDDETANPSVGLFYLYIDTRSSSPFSTPATDIGTEAIPDLFSINDLAPSTGHFLVRNATTVPEPTSLVLLASGFIGIGIARRRRARKLTI